MNMNKKAIIGISVIIGLIGIGWLAHHFLQEDEQDKPSNEDFEVPNSKQAPEKPIRSKPQTQPKKKTPVTSNSPVASIPRKREKVSTRTSVPVRRSTPPPSRNPTIEVRKKDPIKVTRGPKVQAIKRVVDRPKADEFPLRKGSKGPKVERLNVWLTRNHGWSGKITDEFDDSTEHKLVRMTRKNEIDERTYRKMRMERPVFEQKILR